MSRDLTDLEREQLGVDLQLRDLWAVLEPMIVEADAGGERIGVPQLGCAMRAAYARGFADALAWVDGLPSMGSDGKVSRPP